MKKTGAFASICFVLCILFTSAVFAQDQDQNASITGKWKTINEKTQEPKSIVEIYEKDNQYFGRIVKLFRKPGEDPSPVCDKCPDDDPRKDKPVIGMVIIQNMVKDGNTYSKGTILDPKEGKIYNGKLWLEQGNLMVRGYVAFFFRTQTWLRVE